MAGEGRIWPVRLAVNEWPVFAHSGLRPASLLFASHQNVIYSRKMLGLV